ncbi:MAG: phosphoglucomutase/phosphomannomutase family protein, partial [Cyanobium sp.]
MNRAPHARSTPMASAPLPLEAAPIAFGTDGWRGLLGVDITVERLLPVAAAAAAELAYS